MAQAVPVDHDIARTYALLGGRETIRRPVRNSMEAHDVLMAGLPSLALLHLTHEVGFLASGGVLDKAIGISLRTLQRRRKDGAATVLNAEQSNRTWKFAEILGRATEIFGSKEDAEAWMNRPAIGLDQRRPIDLMATPVGTEAVEDYLTRIEYGVYA
jgi:putative toxin-antitoxin system antitoxin component (TIGR02293 family)